MKLSFHLYFGCFFLMVLLFSLLGCNIVAGQSRSAMNYYEQIMEELEDSHFAQTVMQTVVQEGKKRGYEIILENDSAYQDRPRYQVTLKYRIQIPIFQYGNERKISGYAI